MSVQFFRGRQWVTTAMVTVALAAMGLWGLSAATVGHNDDPPATVKVAGRTDAATRHGYAGVVKQVLPAVVNVSISKVVKSEAQRDLDPFFRQFFGDQFGGDQFGRQFQQPRERREHGLGSGVIVSPEGYVLTNNHVVDGASEVTVTLYDKREMKARVVGTDPRTDIAVLKLNGSNFPHLTLGDSSKVEVGDIVLAVGDPFGVGQTVTQGIVSATGRGGLGIEEVEDFIQTDAPINPGNSGGALVDEEGHLIAINTAIVGNSGGNVGIGFAVPINMARHDMDQIIAHGKVDRAYMGILPQDVTPAIAQAMHLSEVNGALVGDITPESPAAHSSLKRGDIITAVNGQAVGDANQLRLKVGAMDPHSNVTLKVLRDGKTIEVPMQLGEFPSKEERADAGSRESGSAGLDGVSVETLNSQAAAQLNLPAQTRGVVVDRVNPSSRAAEAGLKSGDVIQEVNHQPVQSASQFNQAVRSSTKDAPVLVLVNRGGNTMYVAIS
jgi:serine protease Do